MPAGTEIVKVWGADMDTSASRYVFTSQSHNARIVQGTIVSLPGLHGVGHRHSDILLRQRQ